jgi:hypothetical protein
MASTADRIRDIGPQPQSFDMERATKENTNYRSVAWSGRYLQVTLMSIPAGGDIGLEDTRRLTSFCVSTLAAVGCRWDPRKIN